MTARPATTTTCFGDVDTAALERLESSYDTTRLLAAVDIVDRIRIQLHDPEGLRDDLLEIHSMAHSVLNGAPSVPARGEGTLPERVLDALDQIDEFVMELNRMRTILEPLEALQPDDAFGAD
ncbi:MAG: transposase [Paraburkholderia sp.]|uniref:Tn3 family transposase post-transcriptional regulator TnpC n=1 Tax=Paraburkholderia sp. TaxID=1926495 RepID=UPI001212DFA3|nr:Tn3 family transposase post-transcriptional regulator TnpC [Paraburkholderia sp.]TAM00376.1 MAG: transposase [Paraburkholderia sp.]